MHVARLGYLKWLFILIISVLSLSACIGEGDGKERIPGTPQPPLTGVLVDSPVSGASWQTSSGASGVTNAMGEFQYLPNEMVTFSIGGIVLGTAQGAPYLTSVQLTNSIDPSDSAVVNQLVFLQSLDDDSDLTNGINISAAVVSQAQNQTLDFRATDFDAQVAAVIAALMGSGAMVVDRDAALLHFFQTYSNLGGAAVLNFPFPGFAPAGFELVFADEFNSGTTPNADNWTIETGYGSNNDGWGNNEWQLYTESSDNVSVENGNLVLSALCDTTPCGSRDGTITSGKINSLNKFNFKFGKVIARIKPPVGKAAWPAFWALGANHPTVGWPRSGEIDFMEMHNAFSNERTTHFTMHWCEDSIQAPEACSFPDGWVFDSQNRSFPNSLGDDFHIFEADWDADRMIGKIDGITVFTRTIDPVNMDEFLRKFYMILNVAMGGTLGSNNQLPDGSETFPQTMLVDYVRVFQKIGGPADAFAIDFEDAPETYDFGLSGGFGGGAAEVVPNPVAEGINTSAQVGRMLKFQGEVFAGSKLALPEPLVVASGSKFTMKVWSPRAVDVLLKLEGAAEVERNVTHGGTGWEELTFDFGSFSGSADFITLIFDLGIVGDATNDPVNWTFYFDDITLIAPSGGDPGGGDPVDFNGDFEGAASSYDFGASGGFGGGAAAVIPNPVPGGINTSSQVVQMLKFSGDVFAGSKLFLSSPLEVVAGTSFTMKVWSPRPVMVLLKLEGATDEAEVNVSHGGTGWELLTFNFGSFSASVEGITFIFDLGIVGDATNDPDNWTFYFDDLTMIPPDTSGGGDLAQIDLPITFDSALVDYTVIDFGTPVAAMTTLAVDPDDSTNTVASTVKPINSPVWAGTTISTTDGLANAIPFTVNTTTIGVRVYSPGVGIPVRLKAEDAVGGTVSVESEAFTTVANQWETLVFDFANHVVGDPLNVNANYKALSIFFNFGTDGNTAGALTFLWDDVEFGVEALDVTAPTLSIVNIASNNATPTLATVGDTITISLTADESIVQPIVMINGAIADTVTGAGSGWQAKRTLTANDVDGVVTFSITVTDTLGNEAMSVSTTTDDSLVTVDATPPTVSIQGAPASINSTDPISVTFNFSEAVTGFDAADIQLDNGTASNFEVVDAQTYRADITPISDGNLTINVNLDAAQDAAGNASIMAESTVVLVDITAPTLTAVTLSSSNASASAAMAGDTVTVMMTASELIMTPTVIIAGVVADSVSGSDTTWQATRTLTTADAEGPVAFSITYSDTVGNAGTPVSITSDSSSVVLDYTSPTVTISGAPPSFDSLQPIGLTVQFSESVVDFAVADLQVSGGAASQLISIDGSMYTLNVTPNGNGNLIVALASGAVRDVAGNLSDAATPVTVTNALDSDAPLLTVISISSSNNNPSFARTGDVVTVEMVANEDIVAPIVTIAGVLADSVTGSGVNWLATRTLLETDVEGPITFLIEFEDLGGTPGPDSTITTDSSSTTFDRTAPTLTLTGVPATVSNFDPFLVTFEFSENVIGFEDSDISVINGSLGVLSSTNATSYEADVTPDGDGDITISVADNAATDLAGNLSLAVSADVQIIDVDPPTLTDVSIVSNNANSVFARVGDTVTVSFTASEDITSPTVSINGAVAGSISGAGSNWQASRVVLAGDAEGVVGFTIDFEDTSGNVGTQVSVTTDSTSVVVDRTAPTLSITGVASIVGLEAVTVTFTFSEDVIGFDGGDITVTNGTQSAFSSTNATTYTAEVTPDGNGDLTVNVSNGVATDAAGNVSGGASVSATVNVSPFWQQIWSDGFEGSQINAANWTARTDADCPTPCLGQQSYTAGNVSVSGGVMSIEALNNGVDYSSGLIDSRGKFSFKYGRVEIDARLPATLGAMPSLWMLPVTDEYGPWPQSGEIDIANATDLGVLGNQSVEQALHYGLPVPQQTVTSRAYAVPSDPSVDSLTYAIEWEGGVIRWFVDGVHVLTQSQDNWYAYSEDVDGVYELGTGGSPFDEEFYLVLSLAVGDNANGTSSFPQSLEIEEVRVFRCANAIDPTVGAGCGTADPNVTPIDAPNAPFTEMLEVYTDATAVLSYETVGPDVENTLTVATSGAVALSNPAFDDSGNTVWRVTAGATGSSGEVVIASEDLSVHPILETGFHFSGAEAAGELLFDMRVNAFAPDVELRARMDSGAGNGGEALLTLPTDTEWHTYSVKIADLMANPVSGGTGIDLSNVTNLFVLEARNGLINVDIDNIRIKVACRDNGVCQANARFKEEEYLQDFEALVQADTSALSDDGWLVFGSVFQADGVTFIYGYGSFPAPNFAGPGFSSIADSQGGGDQGAQQLSIYNDYNNADHGNNRIIEASVFKERSITAGDVGKTLWYSFDAKLGNLELASTAAAFIKTLDPANGFQTTNIVQFDTTAIPSTWARYSISLEIDASLVGQLLQFGFSNRATNFEGSGVFYDNIQVRKSVTEP